MLLGVKNDPFLDPLLTLSQDLINSNQTFKKLHSLARGKVKTKYSGSAKRFGLNETNKPWPSVREDSGVSQRVNLAPTRPIKWKHPQSRLVIRQKVDGCYNRVKVRNFEQSVSFCDKEVQTYSVILTQSFEDSECDLTCLSIDHSLTGRDTDSDSDDSQMDSLTQLSTLSLVQPDVETSVQLDVDTSAQLDVDISVQSDVDTSVQSDVDTSVQSDVDTSVQSDVDNDILVQSDVETSVQSDVDTSVQLDVDTSVQPDLDTSVKLDVDTSVDQSNVETSVQLDGDTSVQLDVETSVQSDVDNRVQPDVENLVPSNVANLICDALFPVIVMSNVCHVIRLQHLSARTNLISYKLLGQFTNQKVGLPKESTASTSGFSTASDFAIKSQNVCPTKDPAQAKNLNSQHNSAPISYSQAGHDIVSVGTTAMTFSAISMVETKTLLQGVSAISVVEHVLNNIQFHITGKVVTNSARYSNNFTQYNLVPQLSHIRCQYNIHKYNAAVRATPKSLMHSRTFLEVEVDHINSEQLIPFNQRDTEENSGNSLNYPVRRLDGNCKSAECTADDYPTKGKLSENAMITRYEASENLKEVKSCLVEDIQCEHSRPSKDSLLGKSFKSESIGGSNSEKVDFSTISGSYSEQVDLSCEEILNKDLSNDDLVSELIQRLESLYITALDSKEEF